MNGNLIACPNTNQTSATRPAQMPATSPRSEMLLRILQIAIPQRRAASIKIDVILDLQGETMGASSIGLFCSTTRGFNRVLELTGLRVSGRKCSNENRIALLGELIRFFRELHCDLIVSQRFIRPGRHHPGEIV